MPTLMIDVKPNGKLELTDPEDINECAVTYYDVNNVKHNTRKFIFRVNEDIQITESGFFLDFIKTNADSNRVVQVLESGEEYYICYGNYDPNENDSAFWKRMLCGGVSVIGVATGIVLVYSGVGVFPGKVVIDTSLGMFGHALTGKMTLKECGKEAGKSMIVSAATIGVGSYLSKGEKLVKVSDALKKAEKIKQAQQLSSAAKFAKMGERAVKHLPGKLVQSAGSIAVNKGISVAYDLSTHYSKNEKRYEIWKNTNLTTEHLGTEIVELIQGTILNGFLGTVVDAGKFGLASKKGFKNWKVKNAFSQNLSETARDRIRIASRAADKGLQAAFQAGGQTIGYHLMEPGDPIKKLSSENLTPEEIQKQKEEEKKHFRQKLITNMLQAALTSALDAGVDKAGSIKRKKAPKIFAKEIENEREQFQNSLDEHPQNELLNTLHVLSKNEKTAIDVMNKKDSAKEYIIQLETSLNNLSKDAPNYESEKIRLESSIEINKKFIEKHKRTLTEFENAMSKYRDFVEAHPEVASEYLRLSKIRDNNLKNASIAFFNATQEILQQKKKFTADYTDEDIDAFLRFKDSQNTKGNWDKIANEYGKDKDSIASTVYSNTREQYLYMEDAVAPLRKKEFRIIQEQRKVVENLVDKLIHKLSDRVFPRDHSHINKECVKKVLELHEKLNRIDKECPYRTAQDFADAKARKDACTKALEQIPGWKEIISEFSKMKDLSLTNFQSCESVVPGFLLYKTKGSGNGLFQAVAINMGIEEQDLRMQVVDYLNNNKVEFKFLLYKFQCNIDIQKYIDNLNNGIYQELSINFEVTLLMRALNRPIVVMESLGKIKNLNALKKKPKRIFNGEFIFVYFNKGRFDAYLQQELNPLAQAAFEEVFPKISMTNNLILKKHKIEKYQEQLLFKFNYGLYISRAQSINQPCLDLDEEDRAQLCEFYDDIKKVATKSEYQTIKEFHDASVRLAIFFDYIKQMPGSIKILLEHERLINSDFDSELNTFFTEFSQIRYGWIPMLILQDLAKKNLSAKNVVNGVADLSAVFVMTALSPFINFTIKPPEPINIKLSLSHHFLHKISGERNSLFNAVALNIIMTPNKLQNKVINRLRRYLSGPNNPIDPMGTKKQARRYFQAIQCGGVLSDHDEMDLLARVLGREIIVIESQDQIRNIDDIRNEPDKYGTNSILVHYQDGHYNAYIKKNPTAEEKIILDIILGSEAQTVWDKIEVEKAPESTGNCMVM